MLPKAVSSRCFDETPRQTSSVSRSGQILVSVWGSLGSENHYRTSFVSEVPDGKSLLV